MSTLPQLKGCTGLADVAHLLGFKAKALAYLAWGLPPGAKYTAFEIPKRTGGKRTIHAPIPQLKLVQKRLSDLLQTCEQEIEVAHGVRKRLAHGFKKEHSIFSNADVHRCQRYILNFDLEDFFGTINFGRVRGFFITNRNFSLHPDVATVIAQLVCHQSKLPQGSPTSPVISNLIGNILDIRLAKVARANGCAYSRYADDLTLSTSAPTFPSEIAIPASGSSRWVLAKPISDAVHACGFRINHAKTRLLHRRSRQDVTGIVVNRHPNVNADYRRMVRAMVDSLRSTGTYHRSVSILDTAGVTSIVREEGTKSQLHGMLSFVLQAERYRLRSAELPVELSATERLLKRFLFYTVFANAERPVLLFEGKTDNIYVTEAIRSLGASYPLLSKPSSGELLIKPLRATASMERIFGLAGGEQHLKNFVKNYHEEYRHVKGPRGQRPVIAIFDNDGGAKSVLSVLNKKYKIPTPLGAQYFHANDNLYVALTSPLGGPSHCIEDCFDEKTRSKKIGDKVLNLSNKSVEPGEYGKGWFAEKIVKPDARSIDFSGFAPLLTVISEIIRKHVPTSS